MTAVEWLVKQYENNFPLTFDAIKQAKEMEKEQIIKACNEWFTEGCRYATGFEQTVWQDEEDYYNETFKSE